MAARLVGVEPSSPCVQLECLANLLRNRVNSQRHPNLYEVWRQKIAEDIKKQTVRRLCWDGKVPGICAGTRDAAPLAQRPLQDTARRVRAPAPSPTRARRAAWHQEVPGCWKSLGDIETKWETHRSSTHPLGLWMPAPEKLGCRATPGEGRSWAMSDPDSGSLRISCKVGLCEKPALV